MRPVLIDCDPGTDDALAIFAALNSPDLEVVGITTVGGNASLADTTRNALELLAVCGRGDIPVWRGAAGALTGEFTFAYEFHGTGGIGAQLPAASADARSGSADAAIAAAARQRPGELTLIALGPLTNVATALGNWPELAGDLAEILVMGGALQVPGNVTAHAEFNIYNDPEAAAAVCSSGVPVALVGLDVTTAVSIDRSSYHWRGNRSRTAAEAGRILDSWFATHPDFDRYDLHDPLTVAAAIDPEICDWRSGRLVVGASDGPERGRTVLEDADGSVRAAVGVDAARALAVIRDLVQGGGRPAAYKAV